MEDNVPESRNVQLLREYHDALQSSDGERMADMLASDLRYWISPGSDFSGTHDKASILVLLPAIFDAQSGPTKLTYHDITAQDDRVSVVADGTIAFRWWPMGRCRCDLVDATTRPITGCSNSGTPRPW